MARLVLIALAQQESVDQLAEQVRANDPEAVIHVTKEMALEDALVVLNSFEVLTKDE